MNKAIILLNRKTCGWLVGSLEATQCIASNYYKFWTDKKCLF